MVEDRGMDGNEFLQTSRPLKPRHRAFPSSRRQVGVLCSAVQPVTVFLQSYRADRLQRRAKGAQQIGDNTLRLAVPPHRFLQEFQRCFLVPRLRHEALQNLAFMIDRPPGIMALAVDLHENSSRRQRHWWSERSPSTRRARSSEANIWPKRFYHKRTVSWLMSMPRSCSSSSTLRSDRGNQTYIMTVRPIIYGLVRKYLKRASFVIPRR